jgi:hypothetical protein
MAAQYDKKEIRVTNKQPLLTFTKGNQWTIFSTKATKQVKLVFR